MENTKPWWQSRTIWASVLQVALGVAVSMGVLTSSQSGAILTEGPDLIVGISTAVLGAWGLYGRAKASTKLTGV
jgi:hypothetical protein